MGAALIIGMILILAYGAVVSSIESIPILLYLLSRAILLCEASGMALSSWERRTKSRVVLASFFFFSIFVPSIVYQIAGIILCDINSARIAAVVVSQVLLLMLFLTDRFLPTVKSKSAALLSMYTLLIVGVFVWGNYGYACYTSRAAARAEGIEEFVIHEPQSFAVYTTLRTSWEMLLVDDSHEICYLSLPFLHTYPFASMPAGSQLSCTGASAYINGVRYLEVYSREHNMAGYVSEEVLDPIVTYSLRTKCDADIYGAYIQEVDAWNATTKKETTAEVLYVDLEQVLTKIPAGTTVESTGGTAAIRSTGYEIIGYEPIYLSDGSVGYVCKEDIETVKTPFSDT